MTFFLLGLTWTYLLKQDPHFHTLISLCLLRLSFQGHVIALASPEKITRFQRQTHYFLLGLLPGTRLAKIAVFRKQLSCFTQDSPWPVDLCPWSVLLLLFFTWNMACSIPCSFPCFTGFTSENYFSAQPSSVFALIPRPMIFHAHCFFSTWSLSVKTFLFRLCLRVVYFVSFAGTSALH